jgi:hypothetical protein
MKSEAQAFRHRSAACLALALTLGGFPASAWPGTVLNADREIEVSSVLRDQVRAREDGQMAELDPPWAWREGEPGIDVGNWIRMDLKAMPVVSQVDPPAIRLPDAVGEVFQDATYGDMRASEQRALLEEASESANERPYEPEIALIARNLPLARTGDPAALQALIRLVDGVYIASAEGDERLNAIYLDPTTDFSARPCSPL